MLKFKDLDVGVREQMEVGVKAVEEAETRNGKSYVIFTVTDGEQEEKVKKWDSCLTEYENAKECVVFMNIKPSTYMGEVTYDTDMVTLSPRKFSDFVKKPGNIDEMLQEILERVSRFESLELRNLVTLIFYDYKDKLSYWAAAKSNHHAIYGGLVYHIYRMGKAAESLCEVYKDLNKELLMTGAYLHDIGKLFEMETSLLGVAEYTTEGNLLGHHYMGIKLIEDYSKKANISPEILLQLEHMIASHHGKHEWGAIVEPKTMEAQMLHYLDMIDSRIYVYEDAYKTMDEKSFKKTPLGQIYKPEKHTL